MADLDAFEQMIKRRLEAVADRNRREQQQLQARMTDLAVRHEAFVKIAERLTTGTIRPRVEKLVTFFDNARLREGAGIEQFHCGSSFIHSIRFPATVTFDFGVAHDEPIEKVILYYDLEILPVFLKFTPHAETVFPLEEFDEASAAKWIEQQIVCFLDAYLQLEQLDQYQRTSIVSDPVCGMRIRQPLVAAKRDHRGSTYSFCTEECATKFEAHPEQYVAAPKL